MSPAARLYGHDSLQLQDSAAKISHPLDAFAVALLTTGPRLSVSPTRQALRGRRLSSFGSSRLAYGSSVMTVSAPDSQEILATQEQETLEPNIALEQRTNSETERIKSDLFKLSLFSGRGAWARESERAQADRLVKELEDSGAGTPAVLRDGVWELVLSDLEPFRASIFFLALAHAVEANIMSGVSDGALTVHSRATGGGEVKRVAHVVEGSKLHSLVELRSGSLPSLPLALQGTIISTGSLYIDESGSNERNGTGFSLSLESTSVQENTVQYGMPRDGSLRPGEDNSLLSWIGNQIVPSGDIFKQVLDPLGGGQVAKLELSYADDDMLIWRLPKLGGHYFVMARGEESNWPAMDEFRQREASAQTSPVGSAFALGMLNPFFSRRVQSQSDSSQR